MKLGSLFEKVENPLEHAGIYEKFISFYRNTDYYWQFKEKVMSVVSEENNGSNIGPKSIDCYNMLNINVFNDWKKSVLMPVTDSFFEKKKGVTKRGYDKLQKVLSTIKDAEVIDDVNDAIVTIRRIRDEVLEKTYESCYYFSLDDQYRCYNSALINVHQEEVMKCEHALIFNVTSKENIFKFCYYFLEKCREKGLIYNFRYKEDACCDDNIIIYSSTEKLKDYLLVIAEIKKEHSDFDSYFFEPSILVGKINDIVGYGSVSDDNLSYVNLRLDFIYKVIDSSIRDWIRHNLDLEVNIDDCNLTVKEVLSKEIIGVLIDKTKYEGFDIVTKLIVNIYIKQKVRKAIKNNFLIDLDVDNNPICEKFSFSEDLMFKNIDLNRIIKKYVYDFMDNDSRIFKSIRNEIEKKCISLDIDFNMFCFNKDSYDSIKEYDKEIKSKNNSTDLIIRDFIKLT